jgi:glyoxylase-like metal-dependent hydrolase (beta-lactamase superfamily II)
MKIQYQDSTITIFESALYQTTSTIINLEKFILIVDPNWLPIEISTIQSYVEKIRNSKPIYLLFTHSDYDHIIGYRAFPDAKVIASEAFQNNPEKDKIIEQINNFDDENYILRNYPIEYPKVDIIVSGDFQKIEIENTALVFCQAIGHNLDGIFTMIPSLGIFIAGDYLCEVEFPFIYVSGTQYLQTLEKAKKIINQYEPKILIVGHGPFSKNKKEMLDRIKEAEKYIFEIILSIKNKTPFNLDSFLKRYHFPKNMIPAHEKNLEILEKELSET